MNKRFYFKMFCMFTILTFVGFFLGLPAGTFLSLFMASLYLAKIINE